MEENNNFEVTPSVEPKKKKGGLVGAFIIVIILLLGVIGYICYDKFLSKEPTKTEEKADKNEEEPKETPDIPEEDEIISKESILKLAEDKSKYINTDFDFKHEGWDNWNGNTIYLIAENGYLYIKSDSNKSKVSNINEKVIQIAYTYKGCDGTTPLLVLTATGNLYEVTIYDKEDKVDLVSGLTKNLANNKDVELNVTKINSDTIKVLGITTLFGDDRGSSCGYSDVVVYCDDGKYRSSRDFEYVYTKLIVDYFDGYITAGFVVYEDGTTSINDKDIVKNKNNGHLKVIAAFVDEDEDALYIIGDDNYVYIEKGYNDAKIELYIDSKIKSKTIVDTDNYTNNKVNIEFENGQKINKTGIIIGQFK